MALVLVAIAGAADANTYCTLVEANAYHEAHVAGATWTAATEAQKNAALVQATRELDAYITWSGAPSFPTTQALAWPRVGMYYAEVSGLYDPATWAPIPYNVIPQRLKNAVAEQARLLLAGDRAAELAQQVEGLQSLDVAGAVSITFEGNAPPRQVIAPSAWAFVSTWGRMRQQGLGGTVGLARA